MGHLSTPPPPPWLCWLDGRVLCSATHTLTEIVTTSGSIVLAALHTKPSMLVGVCFSGGCQPDRAAAWEVRCCCWCCPAGRDLPVGLLHYSVMSPACLALGRLHCLVPVSVCVCKCVSVFACIAHSQVCWIVQHSMTVALLSSSLCVTHTLRV